MQPQDNNMQTQGYASAQQSQGQQQQQYAVAPQKSGKGSKAVIAVLAVLVLAGAGFSVYEFGASTSYKKQLDDKTAILSAIENKTGEAITSTDSVNSSTAITDKTATVANKYGFETYGNHENFYAFANGDFYYKVITGNYTIGNLSGTVAPLASNVPGTKTSFKFSDGSFYGTDATSEAYSATISDAYKLDIKNVAKIDEAEFGQSSVADYYVITTEDGSAYMLQVNIYSNSGKTPVYFHKIEGYSNIAGAQIVYVDDAVDTILIGKDGTRYTGVDYKLNDAN